MTPFKDYYKTLDISPEASEKDIKSAYLKMAKKWHPDKNPGKDTTGMMQEIVEAYLLLSDGDARSRYDVQYRTRFKFESRETAAQEPTTKKPDFEDEILERWVRNAQRQSVDISKQLIRELREQFSLGFRGALKGMENYLLGKKVFF